MTAGLPRSFAERLIVETTDRRWSRHAETMLHGQAIPTAVIGLRALRDSQVDWSAFAATGELARPEPKTLRQDQIEALEAVRAGLTEAERGKLIMACGTGKTLTGLPIAEELAGSGGHILFLVPPLALMAQTVREWCADAVLPLTAFAVCSMRPRRRLDLQGNHHQSKRDRVPVNPARFAYRVDISTLWISAIQSEPFTLRQDQPKNTRRMKR